MIATKVHAMRKRMIQEVTVGVCALWVYYCLKTMLIEAAVGRPWSSPHPRERKATDIQSFWWRKPKTEYSNRQAPAWSEMERERKVLHLQCTRTKAQRPLAHNHPPLKKRLTDVRGGKHIILVVGKLCSSAHRAPAVCVLSSRRREMHQLCYSSLLAVVVESLIQSRSTDIQYPP